MNYLMLTIGRDWHVPSPRMGFRRPSVRVSGSEFPGRTERIGFVIYAN